MQSSMERCCSCIHMADVTLAAGALRTVSRVGLVAWKRDDCPLVLRLVSHQERTTAVAFTVIIHFTESISVIC